ncbi:hypothetical protein FQZ97_1052200 [compost metagenome]
MTRNAELTSGIFRTRPKRQIYEVKNRLHIRDRFSRWKFWSFTFVCKHDIRCKGDGFDSPYFAIFQHRYDIVAPASQQFKPDTVAHVKCSLRPRQRETCRSSFSIAARHPTFSKGRCLPCFHRAR